MTALERHALFFGSLAVALLALSTPASADRVFKPMGGGGGGAFIARCPSGQSLGGLEANLADDVDSVRPFCVIPTAPDQAVTGERSPVKYGGDGGRPTLALVCPSQRPVVIAMYVEWEGVSNDIINAIHLECGTAIPVQGAESVTLAIDGPHGDPIENLRIDGVMPYRFHTDVQACPAGTVASGINGRSGIWLDAIGLICDTPTVPAPPPPKVVVPSIGKVKTRPTTLDIHQPAMSVVAAVGPTKYSSYLYSVDGQGKLRWYRHDGALDGVFDWQTPRVVDGAFGNGNRLVFAGGDGVIYAVSGQGNLMRYEHTGYRQGLGRDDIGAWNVPQKLASGFGGYTQAFSAGQGVIYAIDGNGKLFWYRHTGFAGGKAVMQGPREVGHGWNGLKAFSGGRGVMYTLTPDGTLRWYKHLSYLTGEGLDVPGAWRSRQDVATGWTDVEQVFANGRGVIYVVDRKGDLFWNHHRGFETGQATWDPRLPIGSGWGGMRWLFVEP